MLMEAFSELCIRERPILKIVWVLILVWCTPMKMQTRKVWLKRGEDAEYCQSMYSFSVSGVPFDIQDRFP